jgi:uncharacterized protein
MSYIPPMEPVRAELTKKPLQIDWKVIEAALQRPLIERRALTMPVLFPGVVPAEMTPQVANDYNACQTDARNMLSYANANDCYAGFMGYPRLAQMLQKSEFREPSSTIASEMTRKWVTIVATEDKAKQCEELTEDMECFGVREVMRRLITHDGEFGRSQAFIDLKGQEEKTELPLCIDPSGIKVGMLNGFRVIEPYWMTPQAYNSNNPLAADYYKPRMWFCQGRRVHRDRLVMCISRELPDLLKPAYNFSGISLTQLIEPYVVQWLRTRDAVSDLIHNFSVLWLKTDLDSVLQGGDGAELFKRIALFIANRDNRGLMAIDKAREEMGMNNVSLANLSDLQAQAQEHLAGPTHIPLVKLWGITPAGLNANSDGEIRVFYDWIMAQWEAHFAPQLHMILQVLQLNRYGKIDPAIKAVANPLHQPTAVEVAEIQKKKAETAKVYVDMGSIDRAEVREVVARDPESGYQNLPPDELPEDPMEREMEMAKALKPPKPAGGGNA